jgi:hypothetical protein
VKQIVLRKENKKTLWIDHIPPHDARTMHGHILGYSEGMLSSIFFSIPLSSKISTTMQMLGSKLGFLFFIQLCNIEHLAKFSRKI